MGFEPLDVHYFFLDFHTSEGVKFFEVGLEFSEVFKDKPFFSLLSFEDNDPAGFVSSGEVAP